MKFNEIKLRDCLEELLDYRGKTPKKLGGDWSANGGYRVLSALNVKSNGLENIEKIRCVDEVLYKRWMKNEVQRGDLLLTSEAPAGEVMLWDSDEKIVLGQRLFALRPKSSISPRFLKYYLQSPIGQREITKNTSGSTVFGISGKMFDLIVVRHPERLDDQERIGDLLYNIDRTITLNTRINAELEAMAKLLYDYWFVQFDYPMTAAQAKRLGKPKLEGKPYKSSGGPMVHNAELKREVPEGWAMKCLNEISEVIMGQSPLSTSYNTEGIGLPLVNGAADYRNGQIAPETYTSTPTRTAHKDDLVFCSRATIGNLTIAEETYCIGRCISAVRPNKPEFLELLYFGLEYEIERFIRQAPGSIIKGITKDDLHEAKFLVPPSDVLKGFHEVTAPQFQMIRNNRKQNQELASLRDWLLPLLMNGQVRVAEAEEQVELAMAAEAGVKYGKANKK